VSTFLPHMPNSATPSSPYSPNLHLSHYPRYTGRITYIRVGYKVVATLL
jgi:hypothetical protein